MAKYETKTTQITTPVNGHVVEIKDWITGRDIEHINGAFFEGTKVKPTSAGGVEFGAIDLSKSTEVTHRNIQAWIVSVDGVKENVLEDVLNMHKDDYNFVVASIDEMSKKK